MSSLTQLPTELRQQVLMQVLPITNRVEDSPPAVLLQLSHINRRLRVDMTAVTAIWTPIHYISTPSTLTSRAPRTRGWNLTHICLDLFYTSFLGRIEWTFLASNPANYTHPELIIAWTNAVPFLPKQSKEVYIDVTPAPGEKRERLPAVLDVFVCDDRASRRFLRGHVRDVAALIQRIDAHYEGQAKIKLTGRLSIKSSFFVKAVCRRVSRELAFVGSWVSIADERCARLCAVIGHQAFCRNPGRCDTHVLSWLNSVAWSTKTGVLYAKVADEGYGLAVIHTVKNMSELRAGKGDLVLSPTRSSVRAFYHQIAADLGLETVEQVAGDGKNVIVRRS